ncbi:MAG: 3-methylornithine--L-lysine ligase PylC [Firmicutes bacterium]|jgi:pyrrolysine biosynthesis protein PylC|nr:3-methylornithine--L-lysine ligase PylC [Bacillota bacterium]HPU01207.1 3-methylornithine--L-lysine ligase PylC [Bacillota bacterium]
MRVAIVGGRLQGVEATYLAQRAGWETVVLDRERNVPASGFAHHFVQVELRSPGEPWEGILRECDFIVPALENMAALELLQEFAAAAEIPLAHDAAAYRVSSSKLSSHCLFRRLGLPLPRPYPEAAFPLLAKPASGSGSRGVTVLHTPQQLSAFREGIGRDGEWIIEEYVAGPGYSIEVLGCGGACMALEITEIQVDEACDCKRVVYPAALPEAPARQMAQFAEEIAAALELQGLMDLEAIYTAGGWRLLEIDARLPSQTPVTVYHATGFNMLEALYQIFSEGRLPPPPRAARRRAVIYEQIRVQDGCLEVMGERIISGAGPLRYSENCFGADAALSSFREGALAWTAILIFCGATLEEAWSRRRAAIETMGKEFGLKITPEAERGR